MLTGTPHTMHYINAKDAIIAKKHVLCEKPVTSNAAELKSLLALAQEHGDCHIPFLIHAHLTTVRTGVFFMEAMWTRFQPLVKVRTIGRKRVDLLRPVDRRDYAYRKSRESWTRVLWAL